MKLKIFGACLIFVALVVVNDLAKADELYFDVGAGIKLQEAEIYGYDNNSPTAHFALGYEWAAPGVRLELSHDSNWLSGPPFNDEWEYHRTEIRVVKRFTLWQN